MKKLVEKITAAVQSAASRADGSARARTLGNYPSFSGGVAELLKTARMDGREVIGDWQGGYCNTYSKYADQAATKVTLNVLPNGEFRVSARRDTCVGYGFNLQKTDIQKFDLESLHYIDVHIFNCGVSQKTGRANIARWQKSAAVAQARDLIGRELFPSERPAARAIKRELTALEKRAAATVKLAQRLIKQGYARPDGDDFYRVADPRKPAFTVSGIGGYILHDESFCRDGRAAKGRRLTQIEYNNLCARRRHYLRNHVRPADTIAIEKCLARRARRFGVMVTRADAKAAGLCSAGVDAYCRRRQIAGDIAAVPAVLLYRVNDEAHLVTRAVAQAYRRVISAGATA